jgi:hypothetical protein
MDLRVYYQKIREAEAKILSEFPIVISKETTDGGKGGTLTEVTRRIAARLVVDGIAAIASDNEAATYRAALEAAKEEADQLAASAKVQLSVVPTADLNALKAKVRDVKD